MGKKEIRNKFRSDVFERDNFTCQVCGDGPYRTIDFFDSHHITDRSLLPNGGYVKENGITVCKEAKPNWKSIMYPETEDEFTILSCHMRCEKFHMSNGLDWEEGLHPDDLYKKIGSSLELAIEKSENLK
jgi:5-methylcytosine-specific restriction endonuclease McrA